MAQWYPNVPTSPGGAGTFGDFTVPSNTTIYGFLFSPTARALYDAVGNPSGGGLGFRERQTTFARGYKEVTTIRLLGQYAFRRRRIVFAVKGFADMLGRNPIWQDSFAWLTNSNGNVRQFASLPSILIQLIQSYVFKGAASVDWFSVFNAKPDTQYLKILSDKTTNYNTYGSTTGRIFRHKEWYPMNKNITYDDDEAGVTESTNPWSVGAGNSMGDVFIWDLYQSINTGTSNDVLVVNNEGTYYWHER